MADTPADTTRSVASRLLTSSALFARSAASAYVSESWEVFHLHLATAVELLVKAVLASAHPSFIADPNADFDSLLHLSGHGKRAKRPEFVSAVRTIGIREALARISRVADNYNPPSSQVLLLLDTRNALVHLGLLGKAEAEASLAEVAQYVAPLLTTVGMEETEYWGDASQLVADHKHRRISSLEAAYKRKVQASKDRLGQVLSSMEDAGRNAFLLAVSPARPTGTFESAPATCPACGNPGSAYGSPEADWAPDWDVGDGQTYVAGMYVEEIRLDVARFECHACGLTLDESLLGFAGLATLTLREDDYDLSEASSYFQRRQVEEDWSDF